MKLSPLQRIKRRLWLLKGSYTHPDGAIELDIDEKAGIDPTADDEETTRRKFDAWNRRESIRRDRWEWFLFGALAGGALIYWWLR